MAEPEFDVFISHASEDKADVALPLANLLIGRGLKVWLDKFELKLGDELMGALDEGLLKSRYGVVILSDAFMSKTWPRRELVGMLTLEEPGKTIILPVLHRIQHKRLKEYSPIIASRISVATDDGLDHVADEICRVVQGGASTGPIGNGGDPIDRELQQVRTALFQAANSTVLRELLYRVEHVLERRPSHVEARMLRDQIVAALRVESLRLAPQEARARSQPASTHAAGIWGVAFAMIFASAVLVYMNTREPREIPSGPSQNPPLSGSSLPTEQQVPRTTDPPASTASGASSAASGAASSAAQSATLTRLRINDTHPQVSDATARAIFEASDNFAQLLDTSQFEAAWKLLDPRARKAISLTRFGNEIAGRSDPRSRLGMPLRSQSRLTDFGGGLVVVEYRSGDGLEWVGLVKNGGKWQVFGYQYQLRDRSGFIYSPQSFERHRGKPR